MTTAALSTLTLPYDKPPLGLNDRMHWRPANRWRQQIKNDTITLAKQAKLPTGLDRIHVTLVWYPKDRRNRDSDNPTPTLKAAIDGLVKYGLIPDDNSEHVTSECVIGYGVQGGRVDIEISVQGERP